MKKNSNIIVLFVAIAILSSGTTYYFCNKRINIAANVNNSNSPLGQNIQSNTCNYNIDRLEGYKFIRPLMYAEPDCESPQYLDLKSQMQNKIESYKNLKSLISASVYLRDFEKGNWINVNPDEQYHPASLLKLALLITFLKMEEKTPGILNKKLIFSEKLEKTRIQTFNSEQIQVGKSYTIKELLQYMVSYSDNNATNLLHEVMDIEEHKRTYELLGLVAPDVYKIGYTVTAKDYSTFLKVLYNAGYLSSDNSEYAFELLTKTDFKNGLIAGLPEGTLVAHKFGEWTDGNSIHQLHESGIIYLNGKAYLLTIMTSGYDVQKLSEVIANITKITFDYLNKENNI